MHMGRYLVSVIPRRALVKILLLISPYGYIVIGIKRKPKEITGSWVSAPSGYEPGKLRGRPGLGLKGLLRLPPKPVRLRHAYRSSVTNSGKRKGHGSYTGALTAAAMTIAPV